ncbi:hypothetical protein PVK62_15030 [Aliivibrio sp. S3MY1]|uniref:hypothetical protein n=1 Tax=unclassified Aliivibrio TaxID=2645654 RepID=UPI0023790630|nr:MULTISPECIES: hypothetical protein [unclassified Aliivibrio]MDD9197139.1 hypothetical protein [Aliivibrio sp. S3MY1]MDD9200014.1 hypothetical protein [Aliivibrio sp. S2MY1]
MENREKSQFSTQNCKLIGDAAKATVNDGVTFVVFKEGPLPEEKIESLTDKE